MFVQMWDRETEKERKNTDRVTDRPMKSKVIIKKCLVTGKVWE